MDLKGGSAKAAGKTKGNTKAKEAALFFYDANCALCTTLARWAQGKAKGRLHIEALQGSLARHYALGLETWDTAHLFAGQKHWIRSAAVVGMLWRLGGVWGMLALVLWCVPKPLRDWGYDLVARRRTCVARSKG